MTSTFGMSLALTMPWSRSSRESGRPLVDVKFSDSAYPSPMCTPPSICSAHSLGLIARPTSLATTTRATMPSSSRMTTCVA